MPSQTHQPEDFVAVDVTLPSHERAGVARRLFVDHRGNAYLALPTGRVHHMRLDATHARQLVDAMSKVVAVVPDIEPTEPGSHDLELRWGNRTVHVHGSRLGTDAALRGPVEIVSLVADRVQLYGQRLELHAVKSVPDAEIVPPWLDSDLQQLSG